MRAEFTVHQTQVLREEYCPNGCARPPGLLSLDPPFLVVGRCKSPARARGRLEFNLEFQTEAIGSVTGRKPRAALAGACTACQLAMGPRASVPCPVPAICCTGLRVEWLMAHRHMIQERHLRVGARLMDDELLRA